MFKAYVHLPAHVEERRAAFIDGLARLGFIVIQGQPTEPVRPGDVAVIWNRMRRSQQSVDMVKAGGGALIVTENGYFGRDRNQRPPYAMALDGHNGSGRWYAPDPSRLQALDLPFQPFRTTGRYVLITDQRGLGSPQMRSPHDFANRTAGEIVRTTHAEVRIREHPGRHKPERPLEADLAEARAVVVWSSNCASSALIQGIPTYYRAPTIVTRGAAHPFAPAMTGTFTALARQRAFGRAAWAQWFLDEIATGEPFRVLLDVHAGKLPTCQEGLGL